MKNILSMKEMQKNDIVSILTRARQFKQNPPDKILKGSIMASCFYEPSTRTRLSFESAMRKMGGEVIGFSEGATTSSQKGESLYDAMKIIGYYSDLIVLRHPLEGAARQAAKATDKPVINAGDGANEHPTQTLLDLFTIQECQGKLEGLNIAFVGDLLYGRTVHSLALALRHFHARLFFIAPQVLAMPDSICLELRRAGIPFSFHKSIEEVIGRCDILYMTRIQQERFGSQEEYERLKGHFVLTRETLAWAREHLRVLHPLPRLSEIDFEVDDTPYAYYFKQAENGLYTRQAILAMLMGK